jgi:uncharacterized protein YkwD
MKDRSDVRVGSASLALLLAGCLLTGCARVVVTRDGSNNGMSVQMEPLTIEGQPPDTEAQSPSIAQMELATINRINAIRKEHGLEPLKVNAVLIKVARDYSRRMCQENFFSHYDPAGQSAMNRVQSAGVSLQIVGENLAKSYNARNPIQTSVEGWMQSPGHRKNILREEYSETGLGIWKQGKNYYFTQLFLRPQSLWNVW